MMKPLNHSQGRDPKSLPMFKDKRKWVMFRGSDPIPVYVPPPDAHIPFLDGGNATASLEEVINHELAVYSRNSPAWTRRQNGRWISVPANQPRGFYLPDYSYGGVLLEGASTNNCLWSRDLSKDVWVKTGCTALRNARGIDYEPGSCSTLTASSPDATCIQSITIGSSIRAFVAWIKRKTGSGRIYMTQNNGAAWTDVTSQIGSIDFARIQISSTLANPVVGFKMETAGDEIYVDMCEDNFNSVSHRSPWPSEATPATRANDNLKFNLGSWFNPDEFSASISVTPVVPNFTNVPFSFSDTTFNNRVTFSISSTTLKPTLLINTVGATQMSGQAAGAVALDTQYRMACRIKANDFRMRVLSESVSDTFGAVPDLTTLSFAHILNGVTVFNLGQIVVKEFKYWRTALTDAQLAAVAD